jgi:hypothetical protein
MNRRSKFLAIGTSVAVVGTLGVVGMTNALAATAGPITGLGGKCVDIAAASSANGSHVQLYDCNGTGAQTWTVGNTDNSIQALGKCLDVTAASTANGAKIQIYDCNGTNAQKWTVSGGQLVNTGSGKCLDATNNSSANGNQLQIWTCANAANQTWKLPGGTTPPPPPPTTTGPTTGPTTPPPPPTGGPGIKAVAPYYYTGWGNPPNLQSVISATGVKWYTMAFMLNSGNCVPKWDGGRNLTGGADQAAINTIRANGGDVVVSFGGASGPWLEHYCTSASALANAYQQVINALQLKAIDIDIEGTPYDNATDQQKTVDALKTIKANNPGITEYITLGSGTGGPDSSLINRAAGAGLVVDGWGIMTFDWGNTSVDQGTLTTKAADGLKNLLKTAYKWSDAEAYKHVGISSMNGITDEHATVTIADAKTITDYARTHQIARLTFWSLNRDRQCPGNYPNDDTCSGLAKQDPWEFTKALSEYFKQH